MVNGCKNAKGNKMSESTHTNYCLLASYQQDKSSGRLTTRTVSTNQLVVLQYVLSF